LTKSLQRIFIWLFIALLTTSSGAAFAQPANDTCVDAILLSCNSVVTGTTVGANPETQASCGTSDGTAGAVWYRFIGTGDEIEVTTCQAGSNYDTKLRVYSGACGALVCVTGNDDASCSFNGLFSRVTWVSVVGVEYKILVHGFASSQGNYEVSLTCLAPPGPQPNDLCANAELVTTGTFVGDTTGNDSDGSSSCGSADASPSVWYRHVATEDGNLVARTCNTSFDTVVSIHSGCPGAVGNELACSDDDCGTASGAVTSVLTGQEYWIRVSGKNGAAGAYTLTVTTQSLFNDFCSGAIPLMCNEIVSGTTLTATPESLGTCGTSDGSGGAVWFSFIGTGDEIEISTCQPGSNYDTKLRVYSGDCGSLVCVAGNDDASCTFSGLRSRVNWFSTAGVEYKILVHGFGSSEGDFEMSLQCLLPPAPDPNDLCVNAEVITAGSYLGDTPGNETDGSTTCGSSDNSPSIWYRYTATTNLTLRVRTCISDYDSVVSIYSGCPGGVAEELVCSDDACGQGSNAQWPVTAGTEYWIRVSGTNGAAGEFTLQVDEYDPSLLIGADVVYTDCISVSNWGEIGGIRAYSLGSYTCNIGDENLLWGTNTPLLGMNAYRLDNGRLVQIGMSWMKRGTGAAAGSGCGLPCNGAGGSVLGVGCLDVYGSGFNGSQGILGPRSQVNAFTGDNDPTTPGASSLLDKRMQIAESDLSQASAQYFIEGIYVAPDDAQNGNAYNNASYKRVTVSPTSFDMTVQGSMQVAVPAMQAWADHGLGQGMPDSSVELTVADVPNEGRFHVASKVTDLGGGIYLYDYAIYNLNSHRSAGSFSVPLPPGATVLSTGFHDVDHHSGEPYDPTDWSVVVDSSSVTWESPAPHSVDPDSNALRFGTMYNFWFETNVSPASVTASLGLFIPGTPNIVGVAIQGPEGSPPVPEFQRGDCNDSGTLDISDAISLLIQLFPSAGVPPPLPCVDACDFNDDGVTDIADAISSLTNLFSQGPGPPPPYPGCGVDPTADALGCDFTTSCP